MHNWHLACFRAAVAAIPPPAGTSRVKVVGDVGNFEGTGNQCEYFAADLRSYGGREAAIEDHYRVAAIRNPLTGEEEPVQICFLSERSPAAEALPPDFRTLHQWKLPVRLRKSKLYVVFALDCADAGFDYRCH